MDTRFGTWNVGNMYRTGSLRVVAGEISEYKLYLVGVQHVRWDRGGTEPAGEYTFFNRNEELITCTLHQTIRMIKSRRMKWAWHVARMGEKRNAYSGGKARRIETTRMTKTQVGAQY
jgi:hypothetical protein